MARDMIATPQPAATVMLLREGAHGMEIFMVVRHQQSDVHAGALVFPGGRVDPEDYDLAADPALFSVPSGSDRFAGALRVAAVRETFEECGVLLAREAGGQALISGARLRDVEAAHRAALIRGDRSFGAMLAAENLVLAPDNLVYFAHWVTPERSVKRFDTHFFLASAPADQAALHDGVEAVDSVWIRPATALEGARAGTYDLRFPTQMNLQKVGRHPSPALAMESARASRVVTVITRQERIGDGMRVLRIPLEADYGGELFEVYDAPGTGSPGG
jgi:8-oxo-dGTP pyrophosphatase MutT (NUDIX family)